MTPSTLYTYAIAANDPSGPMSALSGSTSSTTWVTAVTMPTNLTATGTSVSMVQLTWNPSVSATGTITGYTIERNGMQVATTSALSYLDSGLSPTTTYNYNVSASNSGGNISGWSNTAYGRTLGTTTPVNTMVLTAPSNLMASGTSISQMLLTWNPSVSATGTVSGYSILRNGAHIATTTGTSYADSGLSPNTSYTYNVSASDSGGNVSVWSNTASGMTLNTTTNTTPASDLGSGAGWIVISTAWYNQFFKGTTTSGSLYTYVNGYPSINGNYYDCYGNVDNDMAHHTSNVNDTDPAHHSGQNCSGGAPLMPQMQSGMPSIPGNNGQWVVVPLTDQTLAILNSIDIGK